MKKVYLFSIISMCCLNLYGQFNDTAYIYTYGGIQDDVCSQIKPTYDGGYIMIGTSNSFGCGNTDFYVIKTDSLCNRQWSKTYGGQLNEEGFSVAPTFDHGYAFVGFTDSYGAGGYDVFLVKTDSAGNELWEKTYGGSNWDFGYSLQQLPDSGFIICGLTYSYGPGNGNVYVIRTDKNGDTVWTRTLGGTGYNVANSVCILEDSLYAIIGNTTSFGLGDTNMYFILMDDKGIVKKDTTYGCSHTNIGNSINTTLDNGFIIFGSTDSNTPGKPYEILIKADSLGSMEWMHLEPEPGIGIGRDAIQAADGTYIAVSTDNSYGLGGFAMEIWHFSINGGYITAPSFGGTGDEQGNSVAISKNGTVLCAGATDSPGYTEGLYDAYVVRLKNDSVFLIANYYTFPYHQYKDTCVCILGINSLPIISPEVKIFPNPVTSCATILVQGGIDLHYYFNIYSISGECLVQKGAFQSIAHGQSVAHFERGSLAPGVYLYDILNQEGIKVATGKFEVE